MRAKRSIIPVFVPHLGCPHNCVFCNQHKISGNTSPADSETVRQAIINGKDKISKDTNIQLAFYGGSFTAIPAHKQNELLGAALPFLRNGDISSVRLSTRPDAIDEETLLRLKDYGVSTIELGTQSMCEQVLTASERGHTALDTEAAAALIKRFDFELILQMMTGLPGDTKQNSLDTARRIIALKPDGVRIYPTVIIRDTPLCDLWRKGQYSEHTVEQAVDWCAEIVPMFDEAEIPIIRLGLNPTDDLSEGEALGGAYHPAFGELVRSRLLLFKARELLQNAELEKSAVLGVNKSQVSAMVGQHKCNVQSIKEEFQLQNVTVRETNVEKDTVVLL